MDEVAPGIWHWDALHPRWNIRVHSYYLPEERVVIDPMAPGEGLDWFAEHGPPTDVVLTTRHHYRASTDRRALAVADGAVRWKDGGPLAFVPDNLMDEPEQTRKGLREAYRRLGQLEFDHLLLAHGDPFIGDGRAVLAAFAQD